MLAMFGLLVNFVVDHLASNQFGLPQVEGLKLVTSFDMIHFHVYVNHAFPIASYISLLARRPLGLTNSNCLAVHALTCW
jgi:hypothetical protein